MIRKPRLISKRQFELTRRFQIAYGRLGAKHKQLANALFCESFGVVSGTFSNKVSGTNPVAESEADWMEKVANNPVVELRIGSINQSQAAA